MSTTKQVPEKKRIQGSQLALFIKPRDRVPMHETILRADKEGFTVASNRRIAVTIPDNKLRPRKKFFPCYTGTFVAYIKPDTTFEKAAIVIGSLEKAAGTRYFIEYSDPKTKKHWLFPVPPDHLRHANSILVMEHPDYRLISDRNHIIAVPAGMELKEAVDIINGFPVDNGSYYVDPKHRIPSRNKKYPIAFKRKYGRYKSGGYGDLQRAESMVGLVIRDYLYQYVSRGSESRVKLNGKIPKYCGVIVEDNESGDALKIIQNQVTLRKENGAMSLTGPPEKIAAAVKFLEQLEQE